MAKSAFDGYPRETAVRLILMMGAAGAVLTIAGYVGEITTFWAAGSVLILFAVASWPSNQTAERSSVEPSTVEANKPATRPDVEEITEIEDDEGDALLASAKVQLASMREELARRRQEDRQSTLWRKPQR